MPRYYRTLAGSQQIVSQISRLNQYKGRYGCQVVTSGRADILVSFPHPPGHTVAKKSMVYCVINTSADRLPVFLIKIFFSKEGEAHAHSSLEFIMKRVKFHIRNLRR